MIMKRLLLTVFILLGFSLSALAEEGVYRLVYGSSIEAEILPCG